MVFSHLATSSYADDLMKDLVGIFTKSIGNDIVDARQPVEDANGAGQDKHGRDHEKCNISTTVLACDYKLHVNDVYVHAVMQW